MEAVEVIKGIPAAEDRGRSHETPVWIGLAGLDQSQRLQQSRRRYLADVALSLSPIQGIQKIQPMFQCRGA